MAANATKAVVNSFNSLSIVAVVFSSLSALFGCYFVLFILAIWSTYRQTSIASVRLRTVTVLLFIVLSIHYIVRCLMFAQARLLVQPANEELAWQIPIIFIGSITSTLAGLIADGLLAWRFYVIYGQARWALYLPTTAIVVNALLGFSGDFQHLSVYRDMNLYMNHLEQVTFQVNAAWGWFMFATNTLLTGSIIGRIIYMSRDTASQMVFGGAIRGYSTIIAAIVESALVTWVGLLLYGVATVAPQGHITTHLDVGFVMICTVPVFFGISQCLIIVHLGLSKTATMYSIKTGDKNTANNGMHSDEEIAVKIQREIHIDADSMRGEVSSLEDLEKITGRNLA